MACETSIINARIALPYHKSMRGMSYARFLAASLLGGMKRAWKATKAADAREARRRRKLNQEAASLPLPTLRKVIQAKTDLPDILCGHCRASIDVRAAMTAAFVAVETGRALRPVWPPTPLATPAAPVAGTEAAVGEAGAA